MFCVEDHIVTIRNLDIEYKLPDWSLKAVRGVDLDICRSKVTAIVGESGSGKSTIMSSLLGCISSPGEVTNGSIVFHPAEGKDISLGHLDTAGWNAYRWEKTAMVFQASQNSLNPLMRIGDQFFETAYYHNRFRNRKELDARAREVLDFVRLDADKVLRAYPHELSGGMKQRIMIALAILLDPELVILDEPTTALDVVIQNYIFTLLKKLNRERGISMILLTHDISVVATFADYVAVMYAGQIVEFGRVDDIYYRPKHPYTSALISATPSLISPPEAMRPIPGSPPDMRNLPAGCPFAPRCPHAGDACREDAPIETVLENGHKVICHLYGDRL